MRAVALQRLMGHKDIKVTLNAYTLVFNKFKESEMEKVNDYYIENNLFNDNSIKQINEGIEENEK